MGMLPDWIPRLRGNDELKYFLIKKVLAQRFLNNFDTYIDVELT